MEFKIMMARAQRGFREELRLYLVAVSSLAVAFLCVGGSLLALSNLSTIAERFGQSSRLTMYLRDGAQLDDIEQLKSVLGTLPEVAKVEFVSSDEARKQFLESAEVSADFSRLPAATFPASLEVVMRSNVSVARIDAISAKVSGFRAVDDVESYRGWFMRLQGLITAVRAIAATLAVLVGLCVFAVIGNTIRLAVARRREEIEVMKLCGATDAFVRGPFVLEGSFQGFISAAIACMILMIGFALLRGRIDGTLLALTGAKTSFLEPWMLIAMVLAGALAGAAGSALSLRRYLAV